MPRNKNTRKKMKHRPALLLPVTIGLSSDGARALKMLPHTEFEKMRTGVGTESGWHTVTARLNLGHIMATSHEWGQPLKALTEQALDAVVSVRQRAFKTGKYGLSGDEMKVIGQALNDADDMEVQLTRRELYACHKTLLEKGAYSSNGST